MRANRSALVVLIGIGVARADPEHASMDLEQAMAFAAAHHPIVRADEADVRAATASVDVERAKYTPHVELFAQFDRATANVVPGANFAVPGLPVIAGTPGRTFDGHWGTEVGLSASWDMLGYRKWDAMIDKARADVRLARATADATAIDLQYAAADKFLVAVQRDLAVTAAKAGVDRAHVFVDLVTATVGSDLRAGADLSRAKAELAVAKSAWARAQTARDMALAELGVALGAPARPIRLQIGSLAGTPPPSLAPPSRRDPHLVVAADRVRVAEAERRVLATGTQPTIELVGALFARGSGLLPGGAEAHGLVPDAPNWAVGVLFTWPVLADRTVAPQVRAQEARVVRERAREEAIAQELAGRAASAKAVLDGARAVACYTPDALQAARDAERQTTARFRAQLVTADEVAQVQRLLVQAETDDAVARLDVWRALLLEAYAAGDLAPFLQLYRGGRN